MRPEMDNKFNNNHPNVRSSCWRVAEWPSGRRHRTETSDVYSPLYDVQLQLNLFLLCKLENVCRNEILHRVRSCYDHRGNYGVRPKQMARVLDDVSTGLGNIWLTISIVLLENPGLAIYPHCHSCYCWTVHVFLAVSIVLKYWYHHSRLEAFLMTRLVLRPSET